VPERFEPGEDYEISVTLVRAGIGVGGFQLTARFESGGTQAGALAPSEGSKERVKVTTDRGILYAHQTLSGSALMAADTARWTVRWTAPAEDGAAVVFNVAANAADEDDTTFGDYIYTTVLKASPAGR
jgi:hypothetical protein